jgi:membrane protease YdiL (CAAX protease family)
MAVLIAPFAEEFLFRGLLYRALDHGWAAEADGCDAYGL